ncbi:Hypothetical predicted protein [Lecanosticta acicola]|uniref:Uncharacterized protein n=1 Tax=Lecanosticta acicola TaxID=111012 RepID=A0AAI9EBC4_9PEZI|nr:Hypothetical predicted protein [Lecanosticta acicola]
MPGELRDPEQGFVATERPSLMISPCSTACNSRAADCGRPHTLHGREVVIRNYVANVKILVGQRLSHLCGELTLMLPLYIGSCHRTTSTGVWIQSLPTCTSQPAGPFYMRENKIMHSVLIASNPFQGQASRRRENGLVYIRLGSQSPLQRRSGLE